jgi:hypothetical protein
MEETWASGESVDCTQGRQNRGQNFCDDEEVQLAWSYFNMSQDAWRRGMAQKKEKFWGRIAVHYNEHRPQGSSSRP